MDSISFASIKDKGLEPMDSNMRLNIIVLLAMAATVTVAVTRDQELAKNGCPSRCGNLSIPYPFGTKEGCFLNQNFQIYCKESGNASDAAYLAQTGYVVTDITLDGRLQVVTDVVRSCYNSYQAKFDLIRHMKIALSPISMYNVSSTRNKFTTIGCNSYGYLIGSVGNRTYAAGCMSMCSRFEDLVDGSCLGFGCCQSQIPVGLETFTMAVNSFNIPTSANVSGSDSCSYAFIVEESQFRFSSEYVRSIPMDHKFPASLDWVVSNETCTEAAKNPSNYACNQSECYEPGNGPGYLCKCPDGYDGNPYLPEGCLDIDECEISRPCNDNAECHNLPGRFECNCKSGYEGDGRRNGSGCGRVDEPFFPFGNIGLGVNVILLVSVILLVPVLIISWIYWGPWQMKLIRQREKFFLQNGGIILQQEFAKHNGTVSARIFTIEELNKATNDFHETRILGKGGFGTVYKGILQDKSVVAIKKAMIADRSQVDQFINEVVVLSQVNHRNVVKLLGCCLENEVPLLVYEFISNGTLYQRLHCSGSGYLSWECRLRIAAETADALSYLHSAANPPIIHRDVKSANILLDEDYTAKVSDFGASRLVPVDQTQLNTLVQGTLGYLDPEYFQSSQLTIKSDVYSFGVVLVELLTGRKALCFKMPEEERNLSKNFVSALETDRLFGIIDQRILVEGNNTQIKKVAKLANRCLRVKGDERPSMKEVAMELEGLRVMPTGDPMEADELSGSSA
ncbi:hypothetical protein GQ457_04G038460 [Hibiscus cannabinus]